MTTHPSSDFLHELASQKTTDVARSLIGASVCVTVPDNTDGITRRLRACGIIVETEAYLADDPASHSYGGPTPRNASMFLSPGHVYVYRSYGIHFCLNIVTAPEGVGEAVLIRALAPAVGLEVMAARRGVVIPREELPDRTSPLSADRPSRRLRSLCSGPGKLCQALGITTALDGVRLDEEQDDGAVIFLQPGVTGIEVATTERIGISRGRERQLRFVLKGSPWLSRSR